MELDFCKLTRDLVFDAATSTLDYTLGSEVKMYKEFFPFGIEMETGEPEENALAEKYRYGFNGMEKSEELGDNQYTTLFRTLDTRIGRWWSTDPKQSAWESPYATFGNNPIFYTDPFGDTTKYFNLKGIYLGTINDSYKNRVDFINEKHFNHLQSISEGAAQFISYTEDKSQFTSLADLKSFLGRSLSSYFLDASSVIEARDIINVSTSEVLERGGGGNCKSFYASY